MKIIKLLTLVGLYVAHEEYAASALSLKSKLNYTVFPLRKNEEAAVVEWGNSAIISALDGVVASFGPQTSLGAFFEVETAPVLASPINGRGKKPDIPKEEDDVGIPYPGPLDNESDVHGNMVVMTNEESNMTAVAMARVAKESGAAALMIVNIDPENPDSIFTMQPESKEEAKYAEEHIDIPVIMVSLASGNLITTATYEEGMAEEDIQNNGMPERVRLYAAGDRPFFEDVMSQDPVLYLIHNLLNQEECEMLMNSAKGKFSLVDDATSNLLENIVAEKDHKPRAFGVEHLFLWKGQLDGHMGKQMDERIEQVTGYPKDQFSDWQIFKYEKGSKYELHYDYHPIYSPIATITVFLNEVGGSGGGGTTTTTTGGEIVYPKAGNDEKPIMIQPKKGLAVVHHNTDFEGHFDFASLHGDLPMDDLLVGEAKYVARKYVYATPLPSSKRVVLPILAIVSGGKLPRWVVAVHNRLLDWFGLEKGTLYFDKLCTLLPVLLVLAVAGIIAHVVREKTVSRTDVDAKKGKKE